MGLFLSPSKLFSRRFLRRHARLCVGFLVGVLFVLLPMGWMIYLPPKVRQGQVFAGWRLTAVSKKPASWEGPVPSCGNLSGIVHVADDYYALVSDKGGELLWGEIKVDPETGAVLSAKISPRAAQLEGCADVEGCALSPDGKTLVVTDETRTGLAAFPFEWGVSGGLIPLFKKTKLFPDARDNRSLESLATCDDGKGYWTINEDALIHDGPAASIKGGAWLRLQKVDLDFRPVAQWAYRTDRVPGSLTVPGGVSGVSDLLALPDGGLVVLERALGMHGFRIRLYWVDPSQTQSDVSGVAHLNGDQHYITLPKKLLFEWTGPCNFEGIAWGPPLDGGARSVLLVADDGDPFSRPGLLALKLERMEVP